MSATDAVDMRAELLRAYQAAGLALKALADESEGELTKRVVELHSSAAACLHLVATW